MVPDGTLGLRRWHGLLMAALCALPCSGAAGTAPEVAHAERGALSLRPAVASCRGAAAQLTSDYRFVVGSADFVATQNGEAGSTFRWLADGALLAEGEVRELLALHLDESLDGEGGERPQEAEGVSYQPGRWGSSLSLESDGRLVFSRSGNLDLRNGTIEMWISPRFAGADTVYSEASHYLLHYRAPNGDTLAVVQSKDTGVIYGGGAVDGEWQSAYGAAASMRGWDAGEWHHLAFTFADTGDSMRFYVDGYLAADSNEGRYEPPSEAGDTFSVGGSAWGTAAAYDIDEVRISGHPLSSDVVAGHARRRSEPKGQETWLSSSLLQPGSSIVYDYTPSDATGPGEACASDPLHYPGIPVFDPDPPSTLLPAGSASFDLQVSTLEATDCAFSVGEVLEFAEMAPFDHGAGGTSHRTEVGGLETHPNVVNDVYVRCASHPDFLLELEYRSLSEVHPGYPRTGNLWGSNAFRRKGLDYAARIDLWLGANFTPEEIRELRRLNPEIRVLTSINAIENRGLPADYYLKDVNGERIEVWPNSFRLNLTKRYVAEYQARYAYERILASDLQFDGCFFDNVMTTQSWLKRDIYGREVQIDADEDGVPDDPAEFDAKWKSGVFHELRTFRELMPNAIVSGHSTNIHEPGIAEAFNGTSIGFWTADVIEGKRAFRDLFSRYLRWHEDAREPRATMIESSPPDQIAYGYDYRPLEKIPPETLEFARTYYPYMRFGLAFTLLSDGYFAHEFGDTWHGNDWWYDELDYDLGMPLGPAELVELGPGPGPNLIVSGGFEVEGDDSWSLWANASEGCRALAVRDGNDSAVGETSARIDITSTSGVDWHVNFYQPGRSLVGGRMYEFSFQARADRERPVRVSAQKGGPDWRGYGLSAQVSVGRQWQQYAVSFEASEDADDARLQFFVGQVEGSVWVDDVELHERGPDVYRRDFTLGSVLLNASPQEQVIEVGRELARLEGSQAPLVDTVLDDTGDKFDCRGACQDASYDSGEWQATGPFFHDWGRGCHALTGPQAVAEWRLPIRRTDVYTLTAWWPAAPEQSGWTQAAVYEVVAGDAAIAATSVDQTQGGDRWNLLGEVELEGGSEALVRLRCASGGKCIADALHLRSFARYNDGTRVDSVRLAPMDGIVLRRAPRPEIYVPFALQP